MLYGAVVQTTQTVGTAWSKILVSGTSDRGFKSHPPHYRRALDKLPGPRKRPSSRRVLVGTGKVLYFIRVFETSLHRTSVLGTHEKGPNAIGQQRCDKSN